MGERTRSNERAPRRTGVVAIRVRALGDVLATLAALRAVHARDPAREVTYVVDEVFFSLLSGQTYLARLLPPPPRVGGPRAALAYVRYVRSIRRLRPGVVLDFHGTARTALLTALSGAARRVGFDVKVRKIAYNVVEPRVSTEGQRFVPRNSSRSAFQLARHAGVGAGTDTALPAITPAPADVERCRERLKNAGVRGLADGGPEPVGINPGRAYPAKAWPESRFVGLARALAGRGRPVVVLWGPGERETAERIAAAGDGVYLAPEVTLGELPALLVSMAYVVTIDSGLKHVAVCAGVPTVTLFGATSPAEWHIAGPAHGYLWRGYSCSPCRRRECPFGAPCLGDIAVDDVLEKIAAMGLEVAVP